MSDNDGDSSEAYGYRHRKRRIRKRAMTEEEVVVPRKRKYGPEEDPAKYSPCRHCRKLIRRGTGMVEHVRRKHGKDVMAMCPECPWVYVKKGGPYGFVKHWDKFHSGKRPAYTQTQLLTKVERETLTLNWTTYKK